MSKKKPKAGSEILLRERFSLPQSQFLIHEGGVGFTVYADSTPPPAAVEGVFPNLAEPTGGASRQGKGTFYLYPDFFVIDEHPTAPQGKGEKQAPKPNPPIVVDISKVGYFRVVSLRIPTPSFREPLRHVLRIIFLTHSTESRFVLEAEGLESGRTAEFLWKKKKNKLQPEERFLSRSNALEDVAALWKDLPAKINLTFQYFDPAQADQGTIMTGTLTVGTTGVIIDCRGSETITIDFKTVDTVVPERPPKGSDAEELHVRMLIVTSYGCLRVFLPAARADLIELVKKAWCLATNAHAPDIEGSCCIIQPVKIPLSTVTKIHTRFQSFDSEQNGKIGVEEFGHELGAEFVNTPLSKMLFRALHFGKEDIKFDGFLRVMRWLTVGSMTEKINLMYFLQMESGKGMLMDGLCSIVDAANRLGAVGQGLAVDEIFDAWDTNKEGALTLQAWNEGMDRDPRLVELKNWLEDKTLLDEEVRSKGGRFLLLGDLTWKLSVGIMLGIEKSVSECSKGATSSKGDKQYSAEFKHKIGDGLSFIDHSPEVFAIIRRKSGISTADYLRSLGFQQIVDNLTLGSQTSLLEISSSGKSGSFFFSSYDSKYILKTLPGKELKQLKRMLKGYVAHLDSNADTLLTRFYGAHELVLEGKEIPFVVMGNVFQLNKELDYIFDLKGSTRNRTTPLEMRKNKVALKDNDFLDLDLDVEFEEEVGGEVLLQLQKDADFLRTQHTNDYSFLLGVHCVQTETDSADQVGYKERQTRWRDRARSEIRKADKAPNRSVNGRYLSRFQQYHGGVASKDGKYIFYMGVIDVLTLYDMKKTGEHLFKSMRHNSKEISCVPPNEYASRFVQFLGTMIKFPNKSEDNLPDWAKKVSIQYGDNWKDRASKSFCSDTIPEFLEGITENPGGESGEAGGPDKALETL